MSHAEGIEVSRDIDPRRTSNDKNPIMNYLPFHFLLIVIIIIIITTISTHSGGAVLPAPIARMNPRCPGTLRAWATNPETPVINNPLSLLCHLWAVALPIIKFIIIYTYDFPYSSSSTHPSTHLRSPTGTRVPGDNDPGFPIFILCIPTAMGPVNSCNTYPLTMTNATTVCTQRPDNKHFLTTTLSRTATYLIFFLYFRSYKRTRNGTLNILYRMTGLNRLSPSIAGTQTTGKKPHPTS